MNLFTKQRVVKSYSVAVNGACMVDGQSDFQSLMERLTLVTTAPEPAEPDNTRPWEDPARPLPAEDGEAERIIREARGQAEEILIEARSQAEALAQAAEKEAVQRLAKIETEMRADAYAHGYRQGHEAGFRVGEEEEKQLLARSRELVRLVEKAVQTEFQKADEELLSLALMVAGRIVRATLALEPQRLLDIARTLVLLPREREGMVLHLSAEDSVWASELTQDSFPCPWVKDDSLKQGDCFLQCPEGVYDAQLADQLNKLETVLREELRHDGVEQVSSEIAGG